jgi:hypothetical protein
LSEAPILYVRLDEQERRIVCGAPGCGARIGKLQNTPFGRIFLFDKGWSWQKEDTIWALSKHSREGVARGRTPAPRRAPADLLQPRRNGGLSANYKYPTPRSYPAHIKCSACGALQILDAAQFSLSVRRDVQAPQPITPIDAFLRAMQVAPHLPSEPYKGDIEKIRRLAQDKEINWDLPPPLSLAEGDAQPKRRRRRRKQSPQQRNPS